jgi:glycosyltransferase involved in cell wall biosynthesis
MNPAVSVVTATHNYGRFLRGAVESVLAQSFVDFELIVIDDGSIDGTASIMRPYLNDSRVRYIRTEHRGQPAAKNAGVALARAPIIAFLDGDDVWLPTKLERQMALFQADANLGVVYSRRWLIDEHGRHLEYEQPTLYRGFVLEALFRTNFVCFSSSLVRRSVLDEAGVFDEGLALAIDYDLWLRVALRHRFDYVDEPLVEYRTGHASLSCRTEDRLATVTRIMQRFLDDLGGRGLLDPTVIRRAQAETCYHIGLARRRSSRFSAAPWYLRALILSPRYALAWRGLASLPLPEVARRFLRRILGKPEDWSIRRPRSPQPLPAVVSVPTENGELFSKNPSVTF